MIVGCYVLDLYCDGGEQPHHGYREFPHEFGRDCDTGAEARNLARGMGWLLDLKSIPQRALCPSCVKAGVKLPARGASLGVVAASNNDPEGAHNLAEKA